jgi:hypothetical protein
VQGSIRLPEPRVRPEVEARGKARAEVLRPYRGRYVARKDETVLFDGDTPHEVVAWLRAHEVDGVTVFCAPVDPTVDIQP